MKIIYFLLLLQLVFQDIFCNDSFLSKFHQNVYKVRDSRADVISYSKEYFNRFEIKTYKYNRTTPAMNITANMKIAFEGKIEFVVQGYKFMSNEYRHFPIRFQVNARKAAHANVAGVTKILKNCGNVTKFHFEKDVTYHVCNFVVDATHLPPLIPNGRYKAEVKVLYIDEEIACVHAFGEIYTPMEYPKN